MGSSNGLTNHPGGDVYRGLLMRAGLLLLLLLFVCLLLLLLQFVVVVVAPQGGRDSPLSNRALGSTVTLLRTNGDASLGVGDQAMR